VLRPSAVHHSGLRTIGYETSSFVQPSVPVDFGIIRPRLPGTAAIYVWATKISRVIVVNRRFHLFAQKRELLAPGTVAKAIFHSLPLSSSGDDIAMTLQC
jgi:hypothetical protein